MLSLDVMLSLSKHNSHFDALNVTISLELSVTISGNFCYAN
jgi:hypothetical protein